MRDSSEHRGIAKNEVVIQDQYGFTVVKLEKIEKNQPTAASIRRNKQVICYRLAIHPVRRSNDDEKKNKYRPDVNTCERISAIRLTIFAHRVGISSIGCT